MHIQFQEEDVAFYKNFQHALEYEACNGARNFSFSSRTKLNALPLGLLMGYIPARARQHIKHLELCRELAEECT